MATRTTEYSLPLAGKMALVTGASRGLGEGMAFEIARRGASLILAYASPNSKSRVEDLATKIRAFPHKPTVYTHRADLSSLDGPKDLITKLKASTNDTLKIDILVNNAGAERVKSLPEIQTSDYNAVYDLNVRGVILLTQAALPHLNAKARIINIGSVGARAGFKNLSLYCSSKAALEGLTRCWAAELGGDGTTVNCVNPGPVQSEMLENIPTEIVEMQKSQTPVQNRLGTVEEIARTVACLAGEDMGWVTGQVISASGGWAMY